jgi:hypothetical protein
MKSVAKKFALAALCTTALFAVSQSANAAPLFSIDNSVSFNTFTYGTAPADNNVVNVPASGLVDGVAPTTWRASGGMTNASVSVTGANPGWTVQYTYLGSESGDIIKLSAPGISPAAGFPETNANNNCGAACGGSAQTGQVNVGIGTANTINFKLTDSNTGNSVTNGGTNPAPSIGGANLIFSYATFAGGKYTLTATQTGFVVFGFNDDGAQDDNHDDFMGVLTLINGTTDLPTPIPGALPLFGSVLGGGLLFRRLRKRAKSA